MLVRARQVLNEEQRQEMVYDISELDIDEAFGGIHTDSVLGPDGFNSLFF